MYAGTDPRVGFRSRYGPFQLRRSLAFRRGLLRLLARKWQYPGVNGQVAAIERTLDQEGECSEVLHNISACRGAMEPVDTPIAASFLITDVAVNEEYPNLQVSVSFNGHNVANWRLGPARSHGELKVFVPVEVVGEKQRLAIAFHIEQPRTPHELKWSAGDTRALGFRLTKLRIDPVHKRR